jgi:hypothetical protein
MAKASLTLVRNQSWAVPAPPRPLGEHGAALWQRVMTEYEIADSGGLEMLALACQALDRAESLRAEIDDDGEIIRVRGSIKDHPALKHELANRAFVTRTLAKLGLDVEPVRPSVGRPSGSWNK